MLFLTLPLCIYQAWDRYMQDTGLNLDEAGFTFFSILLVFFYFFIFFWSIFLHFVAFRFVFLLCIFCCLLCFFSLVIFISSVNWGILCVITFGGAVTASRGVPLAHAYTQPCQTVCVNCKFGLIESIQIEEFMFVCFFFFLVLHLGSFWLKYYESINENIYLKKVKLLDKVHKSLKAARFPV